MRPVRFSTADGLELVGEIREPDVPARGAAVLSHPLPTHGGSKDHPVLWAIRNELAGRRGMIVLAFNFRGVMGSEGEFSRGVEEVRDLEAALSLIESEAPGPALVVGWSFGATVALRTALEDRRVGALALLGYPLLEPRSTLPDLPERATLRTLELPVLLLSGEADQFSPPPELRSLSRRLAGSEVVVLPDTGHFFEGREREVAGIVGDFADGWLEAQRRGPRDLPPTARRKP